MSNILDGLYVPTIEEMIDRYALPHIVGVERDCIVLGNVSCTGSDGKVFERYDRLRVDKDIARGSDGNQVNFTPYNAAVHFEQHGEFLPSFALSCNILKTLYENRDDAEVNKVLMQYKDNGCGNGWHAQNTLVDWENSRIIHYPSDKDFPQHGGSNNINSSRSRIRFDFNPKKFKDMPMKKALEREKFKVFILDLTGLQQPETLIEIGEHFNKPAYIWTSDSSEVRVAWLGCVNYYLNVYTSGYLCFINAARGVSC